MHLDHQLMASGLALFPVQAISDRMQATQNLDDSGFGDSLVSIYQSRPESSNGTAEEKERLIHALLVSFVPHEARRFTSSSTQEGYLTGMVEISASVSRDTILLAVRA
jgi:hypothetical protein